jgi:hypothetical protein
VKFATAVVKAYPPTPSWSRLFFMRAPLDPRLYARLSHGPNLEDETWWVLELDGGVGRLSHPLRDSAKPIYSLAMTEFFRL